MKQHLFLALLLWSSILGAADFYWVGGPGQWNDVSHWATSSGGSVLHFATPSANDDVFFDGNSLNATGGEIELLTLTLQCRSLTITDLPQGTLFSGSGMLDIHGDLRMDQTPSWEFRGDLTMLASNGTASINCPSVNFNGDFNLAGAAGTFSVLDTLRAIDLYGISGRLEFAPDVPLFVRDVDISGASVNYANLYVEVQNEFDIDVADIDVPPLAGSRVNFTGTNGRLQINAAIEVTIGSIQAAENLNISVNRGLRTDSLVVRGIGNYRGDITANYLSFAAGTSHRFGATTNFRFTEWSAPGTCLAPIQLLGQEGATLGADAGAMITVNNLYVEYLNAVGTADFTAPSSSGIRSSGWNFTDPNGTDRFWVGGTGYWSDPAHWSYSSGGPGGACPPRPTNDVFFDVASFAGTGDTVYLDGEVLAGTMDWSANDDATTIYQFQNVQPALYGSLRLYPDLNWDTERGNSQLNFRGPATGRELLTYGLTQRLNLNFDGRYGDWTLTDSLSVAFLINFDEGRFNTADHPVRCGRLRLFNQSAFVDLGNSTIHIPDFGAIGSPVNATLEFWPDAEGGFQTAGATVRSQNRSANLTIQYRGNNIFDHHLAAVYSAGFLNLSAVNFYARVLDLDQSAILTINGRVDSLLLSAGGEYDFSQGNIGELALDYLFAEGNCLDPVSLIATTSNLQLTSTSAQTGSFLQIENLPASGLSWTAASSLDLGGNTGWDFTNQPAPRTLYWTAGPGNWFDPARWSLSSGGPGGECPPTRIDQVILDANSGLSAGDTLNLFFNPIAPNAGDPQPACATLEARDLAAETRLIGATLGVYGSCYLSPNLEWRAMGALELYATTEAELLANGLGVSELRMQGSGAYTLLDSLVGERMELVMNNGIFRTNDQGVHLRDISFSPSNRDQEILLDLGTSDVALTGGSINLHMVSAPEGIIRATTGRIRFLRPTVAWPGNRLEGVSLFFEDTERRSGINIWHGNSNRQRPELTTLAFAGDGYLSGAITTDSLLLTKGHAYSLDSRNNLLINEQLRAVGTACNPISIEPNQLVETATIDFATGADAAMDYVRLDRIIAAGPTTPYTAGRNSVNVNQTSSGWIFETNPTVSSLNRFFLEEDRNVCTSTAPLLEPDVPDNFIATYLWQDGSTDLNFQPPGPGQYYLQITFDEGRCRLTDTVTVVTPAYALAENDTLYSCGDSEVQILLPDPSAPGYSWRAETGSINNTDATSATVSAPGKYFLRQELGNCVDSTEFVVVADAAIAIDTTIVLCNGTNYTTAQNTYSPNNGDTERETYASSAGCDSIRTLNFIVRDIITVDTTINLCAGASWVTPQATYQPNTDVTEIEVYLSSTGCDSTRNLRFIVEAPVTVDTTITLCPGGSWTTPRGTYQPTTEVTETEVYLSSTGCDSTRNLRFLVQAPITVDTTITLCSGGSWTSPQGTYQPTTEVTETEVYLSSSGCDSTRNLRFLLREAIVIDTIINLCPGSSWTTPQASYQPVTDVVESEVYTSTTGCDSTRNLQFIIRSEIRIDTTISLCPNASWETAQNTYRPTSDSTATETYLTNAGCDSIRELRFIITRPIDPLAGATITPVACYGDSTGAVQFPTPAPGEDYLLGFAGTTLPPGTTIGNLPAGSYPLTLTFGSDCQDAFTINITEPSDPIEIRLPEAAIIEPGDSISIDATGLGGTPPYDFVWTIPTGAISASCTTCPNPLIRADSSVTLVVQLTDAVGCTVSANYALTVEEPRLLRRTFLPNAFSPNGDGINDVLVPFGKPEEGEILNLQVYDRWGGLRFERDRLNFGEEALGWEGRDALSGTYLVKYRIRWRDGSTTLHSGIVNLLR